MVKLVDQDKSVLVLSCGVLPNDSKLYDKLLTIKTAKDHTITVPEKLEGFFSYMKTPRYQEDAYIAIADSGGTMSDVDKMIDMGIIRVMLPGHNDASLDALYGLRLVPLGYKVKMPNLSG